MLALVLHHIACDEGSWQPLLTDLATAYRARAAGGPPRWEPIPVTYRDYAVWQRDLLGEEDDPASLLSAQLSFWRSSWPGCLPSWTCRSTGRAPRRPTTAATAYR